MLGKPILSKTLAPTPAIEPSTIAFNPGSNPLYAVDKVSPKPFTAPEKSCTIGPKPGIFDIAPPMSSNNALPASTSPFANPPKASPTAPLTVLNTLPNTFVKLVVLNKLPITLGSKFVSPCTAPPIILLKPPGKPCKKLSVVICTISCSKFSIDVLSGKKFSFGAGVVPAKVLALSALAFAGLSAAGALFDLLAALKIASS